MDSIIGKKIGMLTVVGFGESYISPSGLYKCKRYKVVCDCGKEKDMTKGVLLKNNTRSCGCYSAQLASENGGKNKTHGETKTRTYKTWVSMKSRCYCKNAGNYYNYGAKGIKVCDEWKASYEAFVRDMGLRPNGKTLDRIDALGDYNKNNCRWASPKEQAINRGTTKLQCNDLREICRLFKLGKKAKEIAKSYGVTFGYVYSIVKRGGSSYSASSASSRNTKTS